MGVLPVTFSSNLFRAAKEVVLYTTVVYNARFIEVARDQKLPFNAFLKRNQQKVLEEKESRGPHDIKIDSTT